jgi:CubicO group peptidase (beta-lactamase class C family)
VSGIRVLAVITAAALLGGCTSAPPAAPAVPDETAESARRSDDLLDRALAADEPGCSAAVGIEGDVVWTGARGLADVSAGRPIEPDTTFPIASVSKQFTAAVVLLLVEDGELSLEEPLSTWVPGLPPWSDSVTVGQAMHQVSGLPDYVDLRLESGVDWADPRTVDDSRAEIAAIPAPDFPPGNRFDYSNTNYFLLGEVVRAVTGRPVQDVVGERIFEPLDLDMAYDPAGWDPGTADPSSARGYVWDPSTRGWEPAGVRWEVNGDAGVQTTPSELVRWADNYRTGRLGGDPLADGMADSSEGRYGAGIYEDRDGNLGHGGSAAGYLTEFLVSADRRTAIAVACNGDRAAQSDIRQVVPALKTEWFR